MSKTSKRVTPDTDTVFGPSTVDNSSGELFHPIQDDSVPSHAIIETGVHAMKGILSINREKAYKQSSYEFGNHGVLSSTMQGMKGDGIGFEGGVRGGGVSVTETVPSQPRVPKKGFDEHTKRSGNAPTHGVPGVEGFSGDIDDDDESDERVNNDGLVCPHGCGMVARSSHGLARHIHKKHGGFGGLGKAFGKCTKSDGASKLTQSCNSVISSYSSGDLGGSYTKSK